MGMSVSRGDRSVVTLGRRVAIVALGSGEVNGTLGSDGGFIVGCILGMVTLGSNREGCDRPCDGGQGWKWSVGLGLGVGSLS